MLNYDVMHEIFDVLDYCITQNADWVTISKSALSDLNYDKNLRIDQSQIVLRKAFDNAVLHNNLENSKQLICDEVNQTTDPIKKGYLMFEEAKYCQFRSPVEAQRILVSAQQFNVFDKYASPAGNFRVINGEKLLLLKTKLQDFCKAIATDGSFKDLQQLTQLLNAFSLTPEKFFACYSVSFVKEQ